MVAHSIRATVPGKSKLTVSIRNSILNPRCFCESRIKFRSSRLETRYSKFSSFEDRVEVFKYQGTVNLLLPGTVPQKEMEM